MEVPNPADSGLAIEGLGVTYPGRAGRRSDVSLTVGAGETVALVGPSGCGKSTVGVLLGFISPERGSIRIGSVELAELDPDAWRSRLAWVPQRPHLFAVSIAENVRLGRDGASDEEVWAALVAAGLTDVVAKLPQGVQTVLGERGAGLSAGERQRIALARAFLRDAPLLLLDEDGQPGWADRARGVASHPTPIAGTHRRARRPSPRACGAGRPSSAARFGGGGGMTVSGSPDRASFSRMRTTPVRRLPCCARLPSRALPRGG